MTKAHPPCPDQLEGVYVASLNPFQLRRVEELAVGGVLQNVEEPAVGGVLQNAAECM